MKRKIIASICQVDVHQTIAHRKSRSSSFTRRFPIQTSAAAGLKHNKKETAYGHSSTASQLSFFFHFVQPKKTNIVEENKMTGSGWSSRDRRRMARSLTLRNRRLGHDRTTCFQPHGCAGAEAQKVHLHGLHVP